MGLAEDPQPALDQGRVGQHPPVQGAVINLKAALEEQLLDVAIAQRIAQVPRDRLQDQRCLEVPALEIVLRPALQLLDKAVQDHGPPPTTEAHRPPACSTRGKRQNFATGPTRLGSTAWSLMIWRVIPARIEGSPASRVWSPGTNQFQHWIC